MYMRFQIIPSALVLGLGLTTTALASTAGFDGKTDVVCASVDVVACTEGPACRQGSAQSFEIPSFIFVDFKKKVVRGTRESGSDLVSPVKNFEVTESQLVLQGIENHRGWTLAIDRQNGSMSLSASGADVGFMIMGTCTAI
jgi:hypothetical protein